MIFQILSWEQENKRRRVKYNPVSSYDVGVGTNEIHEKRTRFSLSQDQESIGMKENYDMFCLAFSPFCVVFFSHNSDRPDSDTIGIESYAVDNVRNIFCIDEWFLVQKGLQCILDIENIHPRHLLHCN